MFRDPIVEEVREAGAKLTEEAGNDLHRLCENLRRKEQERPERLVRRQPRRSLNSIERDTG